MGLNPKKCSYPLKPPKSAQTLKKRSGMAESVSNQGVARKKCYNGISRHESRFQEAAKTTVGPLHSARSLLPMHSVASYNVFFACPTFLARTWDSIGNDQLTHGPLGPYKLLPEVKSNLTWWSSSCNMAALPVPERSSKSWSGISISIRSKCFQSMFTSLLPKHQQCFWGALEEK
jgi:hypothetical protein